MSTSTVETETERYHALDSVRAVAMLLGVVYHALLFKMFFGGGGPPGFPGMGRGGASRYFQDWLHSFRMPLFFLISGFFARMMLEKYGLKRYFQKRWYRIGVCLVVGMFTFGPIYVLTREALSAGPGGGGPPGPPAASPQPGEFPKPPAGFIPPPLAEFDKDNDGSFSDDEWKEASAELRKMFGAGGPPGMGGPPGGMRGPGGPPGMGGPPGGPFGGGPGLSMMFFGQYSRLVQLNHLWFLWYLLVFITLAPAATKFLGWILLWPSPEAADRLGAKVIRSGLLAPVVMGMVTAPVLMLSSSGPFGWSLGLPGSIFRAFPDFLLHLDPQMVFYFIVFLFGWWLRRERTALPGLTRAWIPNILLGLVAFASSVWLSDAYSNKFQHPYYQAIRALGYTLYALSSASTVFGMLGMFQKYFDKATPTSRYLADTALWVYLIHQPLVLIGLYWFVPFGWPWYLTTAAVSIFSVAMALVLYEAIVRPTAMVRLFGPASARKPAKPREEAASLAPELHPT